MSELIPPLKPRRTYGFLSVAVLAVAAVIALGAAWAALVAVEHSSRTAVTRALFLAGEDWAQVEVNGLQVILSGDAPTEAARFAALSAAGHEVDGARVIDQMALPEAVAIEPPQFSVEMLRNEAGISLIGLIPAATDREALTRRMRAIDPVQPVADFLETAEFPTPEGWDNALDFALEMAAMLPRSKISLSADSVTVEAIATAPDQKREWERVIRRERPAGLRLALDIRAPLDVISPYTLRFLSDDQGARFDACTAYTTAGRNKIISAGIAAGVKGTVDCTIGLGVPSPDWPDAVARSIQAVRDMGGGALTFSDADISLIAAADTPQDTFDRVVGELEADLPEVFSLHSVLSEPETGPASPAGIPEFTASLAESGAVQLRGRVASEQDRTIAETLARARFGTRKVYAPLRVDPGLPEAWAVRTLAGLEALDQLAQGRVVVRPDIVTVAGTTGDKRASAEISRLLSEKLGEAEDFRVNVTYEEALDPVAAMPTPQECVADVNAALARSKITFAPGSADIELGSGSTVDRIAEILKTCPDVAMEIGGYTDSQGREEMNQALSQRRAEAVVSALLARRVLTTNLKAFGYGEEFPIADNDTEEGREANRRIEFSLVGESRPSAEPEAEGDDPTMRPRSRPGDAVGDDTAPDADAATGDDTEAVEPEDASDAGDEAAPGAPDTLVADGAEPLEDGEATGEDPAAEEPAADDAVEPTAEPAEAVPTEPDATADQAVEGTDPAAADADAGIAAAEAPEATAEAAPTDAEATTLPVAEGAEPDLAADSPAAETAETATMDDATEDAATGETAGAVDPQTPAETAPAETPVPDDAPAETAPVAALEDDMAPEAEQVAGTAEEDPAGAASSPETSDPAAEALATEALAADALAAEAAAEEVTGTVADEALAAAGSADAAAASPAAADPETAPTSGAEEPEGTGGIAPARTEADATEATPPAPDATATDDVVAEGADGPPFALPDIPAIRPLARPPIVVNPELAGIRPRPRPAIVPDAPSTE